MKESEKEIEELQERIDKLKSEKKTLVIREGEWLERYVELLFKLSGFETERNKRIQAGSFLKKDVTHEVDVFVNVNNNDPILVECKDVEKFKLEHANTFIGKVQDIKHSSKLIVTSNIKKEFLDKYKSYCERKGLFFLDGKELDEFVDKLSKMNDIEQRKRYLIKYFKVEKKGFFKTLFGR